MSRVHLHGLCLGALTGVLLLAGCATSTTPEPQVAPAPVVGPTAPAKVVPPAAKTPAPVVVPVIEAKPATITGSEESSTMLDNLTVYVTAIDGVAVPAGRAGWHEPLALKPGARRLAVSFTRGVFSAQTELAFTARAEAHYQIKFATDAQLFGKNSYCEFWIVDLATGEQALAPRRVPLLRSEQAK